MAIERKTATPIEGTIEQDPEAEELTIAIENPESLAIETDDGGMIIDFDPNASTTGDEEFESNLAEYIEEDELQKSNTNFNRFIAFNIIIIIPI